MKLDNLKGLVHNAMYQNLKKKGFVAPVDILMEIGVLSKEDYERWRNGQVDYLERVCKVNLKKLSAIMKEARAYARKNRLKPSWTYYHGWGKAKAKKLRFSKSGDKDVEHHYATHFLDSKRISDLKKEREAKNA